MLVFGAALPPAAFAARWRSCPPFAYEHQSGDTTYRFSKLKVAGAPCRVIKKVVIGYFHDKGHEAGSVPSDGYNVYGWNVLIHTNTLDGRKIQGEARFTGVYS